ncbi:DUF2207 domain-containing protein [Clostridium folliculivorans]|uniref:Membrane protein n=1 Tax=Clostridium folliculivorans TaxID=2886038 RepID=A0A9W6D9Q5_9CLOT|nr:DUF2207 domain-containing protein [Clostridium folliculivorans]GKU24585.1 membrane protein [Clostridium folliculivorans]GKU30683.1 membrane protein [Clostridium folliculivorans]
MRKYFKYLVVLLLFTLLLSTHTVYADSKSFSIDSLAIDTAINTSGDLEVSEVYEYNFKGDFNGVTRNINFSQSSGVENIEVSILDGSNNTPFKNNDSKENGTFTVATDGNYKKLTIYSKNSNKIVKFNIKYSIIGAATKYNDAGELFWKFYENSSNVDINNISLKVNFPTGNLKDAKYWGIGPASGTASKADDNNFLFNVSKLNSGEYLGCRILFPLDYLKDAKKIVSEDAYNRIYNEQMNNAYTPETNSNSISSSNNSINSPIYEPPVNHYADKDDSIGIFILVLVIVILVATILIYNAKEKEKFQKELEEYRSTEQFFNDPYCDSIPSGLSPALVTYLISEYIEINDIIATLLDLSVRNILSYTTNSYVEKKYFSKDEEKIDFTFSINTHALDFCSIHERYLLNWLSSYGNYPSFSLKDIEVQTNNRKTALDFKNKFNDWKFAVKTEADSKPFHTKIRNRYVLTNTYQNEYLKWLAFKNFLFDSINSSKSEILTPALWRKYLSYALALGLADKLIEFSPKLANDDYMYSDPLFYNMHYLNFIYYDFFDDFQNQLNHNTADNSSNSSSDFGGGFGDGGGFTSGGDGGSSGGGGDSGAF